MEEKIVNKIMRAKLSAVAKKRPCLTAMTLMQFKSIPSISAE